MSDLENLVPPLELCKKIPAGEFADTYAAYFWDANGENITLDKRDGDAIWKDIVMAPAPTLQEIMAELINLSPYAIKICESFKEWHIECCIAVEYGERYLSADSAKNPATAALKLWLKLEGIEK